MRHVTQVSSVFFLSFSLSSFFCCKATQKGTKEESIKYSRVVLLFVPLFFLFTALYSCQSVTTYCFKAPRKFFQERQTFLCFFMHKNETHSLQCQWRICSHKQEIEKENDGFISKENCERNDKWLQSIAILYFAQWGLLLFGLQQQLTSCAMLVKLTFWRITLRVH